MSNASPEPVIVQSGVTLECVGCALYPGASAYVTSAEGSGPAQMEEHRRRHAAAAALASLAHSGSTARCGVAGGGLADGSLQDVVQAVVPPAPAGADHQVVAGDSPAGPPDPATVVSGGEYDDAAVPVAGEADGFADGVAVGAEEGSGHEVAGLAAASRGPAIDGAFDAEGGQEA
jgi:hypothetical protein